MNSPSRGELEFDPDPGYLTPPLSPSKSVSTTGWTSPSTPTSPRKARSCLFFRDIDVETDCSSPPVSPTKLSRAPNLHFFATVPPKLHASGGHHPEQEQELLHGLGFRSLSDSFRLNDCISSNEVVRHGSQLSPDTRGDPTHTIDDTVLENSEVQAQSEALAFPSISSPCRTGSSGPLLLTPYSDDEVPPSNQLHRIPLRHYSSPLRPSQWTTRGGSLSSLRPSSRTPDRFIPFRRPPNTTRQSFELGKPSERVEAEGITTSRGTASADPFSRRLRRSTRLNNELRTLRETHSVITGRVHLNRRGASSSIRRSSFNLGARQFSAGAVWNVGGSSAVSDTVVGVSNGRGGMLGRRTNAPLYTSLFLNGHDPEAELEAYERRIALALDVDRSDKVLDNLPAPSSSPAVASSAVGLSPKQTDHVWRDNAWVKDGTTMLLDAPQLRDDYYCSLLAYCPTAGLLAVGLGNYVHLWSERTGVDTPESLNASSNSSVSDIHHVTSVSFSSTQGGQAILAVGRADGRITLWSPYDDEPRFDASQPKPISCVSFSPTVTKRPSLRDRELTVPTEELLVGDEAGHIYFYSVEWPDQNASALFGWHGAMTLLARLNIHSQQVCGLAWSPNGELFVSGGNDNACYLFEIKKILQNPAAPNSDSVVDVRRGSNGESIYTVSPGRGHVQLISPGREKHRWELNAAVKAIAFCPWQRGLLAIGGGSNDRCIHFYHTVSGACLATIDCAAQITSLVWSTSKREIAATFGFAQPEHPYRIAVFSWPSCEQVVAIPWFDENRALYAISYPGGPNVGGSRRERGEDGVWWGRTNDEGCLVVAASDAAIRFHEIWAEGRGRRGRSHTMGLLGGSDILENLHGAQTEGGTVIR
ncbi:WD40 repeat-like protein [Polyplosphaeria fusca]|uniref:WD40 repeat-like protein n=1 Tax=Polyplosphaeria fusca TaxID=682080 RepID=A0A9P4RCY4_9PLEO|nr:WD40 repeat-like protein [Polyplosphaeria fusca]